MANYVGALDQGTTSNRFIIFDHSGQIVAVEQKEHEQIFPKPGWVEHNPAEIWQNTQYVIRGALEKSGLTGSDLAAIGITNLRLSGTKIRVNLLPMPLSGSAPEPMKYAKN
jgi:glycerol kinase